MERSDVAAGSAAGPPPGSPSGSPSGATPNDPTGGPPAGGPTRRRFLAGLAATAIVAGCGPGGGGSDRAARRAPAARRPPRLAGPPFTLGVASGDPLADRVILWTRLAPDPTRPDGGMPDGPVDVTWEIATDPDLRRVVRSGVATARPDAVHAVHVDATGLDPATVYHYRFTVGDERSPVGRTRTLPAPGDRVDRLRMATANCQLFESGNYAAHRRMAAEDLDLVLFLGDYIYENPGGNPPRGALPRHETVTLDDYRLRYASYKVDPLLQACHSRFPFMAMWDDHEVANDYAGDTLQDGSTGDKARARKAAAYRAFYEHIPVRLAPPTGPEVRLHRAVDFGDLARISVLDERQYADPPPCRDRPGEAVLDMGDCDERTSDSDRRLLGREQEEWFARVTAPRDVEWNLVGNPVLLAGVDAGDKRGRARYYLETWDGYPAARRRFVKQLSSIPNPVVITGDYHAGFVNDVHLDPEDRATPVVATELLGPPISSVLFPADVRPRNPQVRYMVAGHGYLVTTVERERITAEFKILDDVRDAKSEIRVDSTWRLESGSPTATRVPG